MARGQGRIFKIRKGRIWHAAFYDSGREFRMTTSTDDREKALAFLRKKLDEVGSGSFIDDRRVRVKHLLDDLAAEYKRDGKNHRKLKSRVKPLVAALGHIKAAFGCALCAPKKPSLF